jgi:hypothetical protein
MRAIEARTILVSGATDGLGNARRRLRELSDRLTGLVSSGRPR